MKVKRSFPLTSIEKVEYNADNEPTIFRLIFSNCIEILQADTPEEASSWVDKIRTGEFTHTVTFLPPYLNCLCFRVYEVVSYKITR